MGKVRQLCLAAAALVLPSALVGLAALPSEAAVAPAAGGTYIFASGASGKCVNVAGDLLQQIACNGLAGAQQFKVTAQGSGFTLTNVTSGKCVAPPDTTSGSQLAQSACSGAADQTWTFTASTAAAGKYTITNSGTGLCVSNKDGSTAGNNPIVQETCSDVARMQWAFTSVTTTGGTYTVAKDGTGQYTTVQAAIDAVPTNSSARQVITIKAGTYREQIIVRPTSRSSRCRASAPRRPRR